MNFVLGLDEMIAQLGEGTKHVSHTVVGGHSQTELLWIIMDGLQRKYT